MCTVLLPPGVNPIAVNKYIIKRPDLLGSPFSRVNQTGREVKHSRPSTADVTNEVGLYLYSPYTPSWHGQGKIYHLFLKL